MISNKINTLLNELNSSTWNAITSTSKNSIMDYDTTSTANWSNGYINTTTSSPDGITWTAPYIYPTTGAVSSTKLDVDMFQSQVDELNNKIKRLEDNNNMLKAENNQLRSQNDTFEARLKQLEALVRTVVENIEA